MNRVNIEVCGIVVDLATVGPFELFTSSDWLLENCMELPNDMQNENAK